ncbi:Stromal interaction molecule-like protein [Aphelenchoides bicaudatus]|nr:Stromal interaction molecule-like protein [Aphelenchoides bicaudatus]
MTQTAGIFSHLTGSDLTHPRSMSRHLAGKRKWIHALCLLITALSVAAEVSKPTKQVSITAEDEKLRDPEGYAAIKELHSQMDDDKSGSIDREESSDFLKEDMKVAGSEKKLRENAFHHKTDESVTVEDLWESWFSASEREWTSYDMINWLTNVVRLPQYADNFLAAKCAGLSLPRMALQNSSFLIEILRIKNPVHRQKIQLKALDVVLFGVHDTSTIKDAALAILAASFIILAGFFFKHQKSSQQQVSELSKQLSELNNMETNFDSEQNEDLEQLRNRIKEMEQQMEMQSNYDPTSTVFHDLQPLLRRTYEKEMAFVNGKRDECLNEMKSAKEFVGKMTRKQSSFLNSLKLATGTTTGTDNIEQKIFKLKEQMEAIKHDIAEMYNRYVLMENILGFQIISPMEYKPENPYRFISSSSQASSSSSYLPGLINGGM